MKKLMIMILTLFSISTILFFSTVEVSASSDADVLSFELVKEVTVGDEKILTVEATNSSSENWYYAFLDDKDGTLVTSNGTYTLDLEAIKIPAGTSTYTFPVKATGKIKSIEFSDLASTVNVNASTSTVEVKTGTKMVIIDNYKKINVLLISIIIMASVIILYEVIISLLKKKIYIKASVISFIIFIEAIIVAAFLKVLVGSIYNCDTNIMLIYVFLGISAITFILGFVFNKLETKEDKIN